MSRYANQPIRSLNASQLLTKNKAPPSTKQSTHPFRIRECLCGNYPYPVARPPAAQGRPLNDLPHLAHRTSDPTNPPQVLVALPSVCYTIRGALKTQTYINKYWNDILIHYRFNKNKMFSPNSYRSTHIRPPRLACKSCEHIGCTGKFGFSTQKLWAAKCFPPHCTYWCCPPRSKQI